MNLPKLRLPLTEQIKNRAGRTLLTGQAFIVYTLWLSVGTLAIIIPWLLIPWIISFALLVTVLVIDRQSLAPAEIFQAEIVAPTSPQLHEPTNLGCRIFSTQSKVLALGQIALLAPYSNKLRFTNSKQPVMLRPILDHFEANLLLPAVGRTLGYEKLSQLVIETNSTFRLWHRSIEIQVPPVEFRVSPQLKEIPREEFRRVLSQQPLLYQGSRKLIRSRSRDEFHSIRRYQHPDPIADIDSRKTARFQQPMVRIYDTLQRHHLVLLFDMGRGMVGEVSGSRKADYYLSAALALAHSATKQGDLVSFAGFSQRLHAQIPSSRSLSAFRKLLTGDPTLLPREEESNYDLVPHIVARLSSQRAIVVMLTDTSRPTTQTALLNPLRSISHKHISLTLSLIDQQFDLTSRVIGTQQRSGQATEVGLTKDSLWDLFYAYHLDSSFARFRSQLATFGGAAVQLPEEHWMSAVSKTYSLLRLSLAA